MRDRGCFLVLVHYRGEGVKFIDAPTRTRQREPLNDLWGMGGENNSAPLF
jgi:hypothetical protein